MRRAPLRKDCSLGIVSSLVSTLRWMTTDEYESYRGWSEAETHREAPQAYDLGLYTRAN